MATFQNARRAALLAMLVFASTATHAQQGATRAPASAPAETPASNRDDANDTRSRSLFGRAMQELVGVAVERSRGSGTADSGADGDATAAVPSADASAPAAADRSGAGTPASDLATTGIAAQSDPR